MWRPLVLLALMAAPAFADAPDRSPRPQTRPAVVAARVTPEVIAAVSPAPTIPHPVPRPPNLTAAPPQQPAAEPIRVAFPLLRPKPRPKGLELAEEAAPELASAAPGRKTKAKDKATRKGSICGDPAIKGEALSRIPAKVKGCGIDEPVRVTSVGGVRLNPAATINCKTAGALKTWIQQAMQPAFGNRDVVELRIAASYVCRPRNNIKGNKISEHGRGNAVDVGAFIFADGKEWTVARDYNKQIRKAHKNACGIFGTTLGPGSDGYHEDHLHFDTASYRSGSYCR